jgi:ribosomal protein L37AE/L43A
MRGRRRKHQIPKEPVARPDPLKLVTDPETKALAVRYIEHFQLGNEPLWVTTDRKLFQARLGRPVKAAIGGAYVYHPVLKTHLVLINLERLDRELPKSVEVVVVEEFMHMRDWLDGDRRGHSKHGYDRIAYRVAELTGTTLEEVRAALLPAVQQPYKYIYECPKCRVKVPRKRHGTWSCAACSPTFDRRFILQPVLEFRRPAREEAQKENRTETRPPARPSLRTTVAYEQIGIPGLQDEPQS